MSQSNSQPWYVAGLAFECIECGRCCSGPEEGYVWLTERELTAIARRLGISMEQASWHVRKVGRRMTIIEHPVTRDCVFLVQRSTAAGCAGKGCRIYEVRPTQCCTWPFWPSNLASPHAWAVAAMRCPGINRGPIFSYEEIEARRLATMQT